MMQALFLLFQHAEPIRSVTLWGVVIPAAVLLLSFGVAVALYRHFSQK